MHEPLVQPNGDGGRSEHDGQVHRKADRSKLKKVPTPTRDADSGQSLAGTSSRAIITRAIPSCRCAVTMMGPAGAPHSDNRFCAVLFAITE